MWSEHLIFPALQGCVDLKKKLKKNQHGDKLHPEYFSKSYCKYFKKQFQKGGNWVKIWMSLWVSQNNYGKFFILFTEF